MLLGSKPDLKSAKRAQELRKKGLSIREVAGAMKNHPKSVQRWLKYDLEKLCTEEGLRVGRQSDRVSK